MTVFTTVGLSTTLPAEPYPGLRPFDPNEHRIFFGREEMIETAIDALARKNLVVVHGASGSGKSSFVRAGVLPWLEIQQSRRRRWLTEIRRPAGGPLRNLASALADLFGAAPGSSQAIDPLTSWHTRLALGRTVLDDIEALLSSKGSSMCLLIDQFEELFRYAKETSREEAELLTQLLCSLASQENPAPHLFVILTMRSDYLGECARFDGFAETVNSCQYLLPRLDHFGLLRAIHEPAKLYGGEIDPAVGDRLLFAARQGEDVLPVLQHALMRACAHARKLHGSCEGWVVTIPDLEAVEGKDGALSTHADEVLAEIQAVDPMNLKTAEWLFRSLTELDADGRVIRRPRNLAELIAVAGGDRARMIAVIEAFRGTNRNFLMTNPPGPLKEITDIDISHEALIRCWQRLSDPMRDQVRNEPVGWVWREFEDGQRWRALAVQARVFRNDESATLSPATTETYESWWPEHTRAWAARYARDKESASDAYEEIEELWQASKKALEVERTRLEREAALKHQEHELVQARQTAAAMQRELIATRELQSRTLKFLIGAVTLAIIATGLLAWGINQRQLAEEKQKLANMSKLAAIAALINYGRADVNTEAVPNQTWSFELQRDFQRGHTITTKNQAKDQKSIASESQTGFKDRLEKLRSGRDEIFSQIRMANKDLWFSRSESDRKKIIKNINDHLSSSDYTSDNKLRVALYAIAAVPEEDATLNDSLRKIIEVSPQRNDFTVPGASQVWGLALTKPKQGQLLAAAGDDNGVVWLWNPLADSISEKRTLTVAGGIVNGLAFNADGTLLAAAYRSGGAVVWDLDKMNVVCRSRGSSDFYGAYGVAFSGATLAIASGDREIHLWDTSKGCIPEREHDFVRKDIVFGVAFHGRLLAAASGDGSVAVWDINSRNTLLDDPIGKPMFAVSFSPDGKTLVATGAEGIGYLWRMDSEGKFKREDNTLPNQGGADQGSTVGQISFSAEGDMVVATAAHGSPIVTHLNQNGRPTDKTDKLEIGGRSVFGVAFSPDSKYLLSGSNLSNTVRLLAIERDQLEVGLGRAKLISLGKRRSTGMRLNQTECELLQQMQIPIFEMAIPMFKEVWSQGSHLVCPFPFLGD